MATLLEKIYIKIAILFVLNFFLLSGIWAVDVAVSSMVTQASIGGLEMKAMGLFGLRNPNTQYHLGLGLIFISFLIQTLWFAYFIIKTHLSEKNV